LSGPEHRTTRSEDPHDKKGLIARIVDNILDALNIQQASAWRAGRGVGHQQGSEDGYTQGFDAGVKAGTQIVELRPGPKPLVGAPQTQEPGLFEDWRFPIDDEMEKRIRADVARLLPDQPPSSDQWKMILSRTPTTSVVAGAGSGKSTTMVVRLLVLYHYLEIEFSSLTVVTFTRESKLDFAKKLREVFLLWEHEIPEKQSLNIVRTFHSRILSFVRSIDGLRRTQAFEFLDLEDEEDEKAESMFQVKLKKPQLDLMNGCYQDLYLSNPRFKELITHLFRRAAVLEQLDRKNADVVKRVKRAGDMAEVDGEVCDLLEQQWTRAGKWPLAGVEPIRQKITVLKHQFSANGYIPALDAFVLLGVDHTEQHDLKRNADISMTLKGEVTMKRTMFQAFCSRPVIILNDYNDAYDTVEGMINLVNCCPKFRYKVTGEIGSLYIMEAFYAAASFIENLGLDVVESIKKMKFLKGDPDSWFFEALAHYWPAFEEKLSSMNPPIMTFNSMFAMFGERGAENLKQVPEGVLRPMTTLLIDEFQDVGSNTISWICAAFSEIKRRGLRVEAGGKPKYASLMAVGDDWQSIYGWRGSSPKFFMHFDEVFNSPKSTRVFMQENHRSHQLVIDAAEAIVRSTGGFDNKQGVAVNEKVTGAQVPVRVVGRNDKQLADRALKHYEAGHSILVLYRVGKSKEEVLPLLAPLISRAKREDRENDIKLLTYHASKGLQAKAVFLIGDCEMTTSSPYKNQVYQQAGMSVEDDPKPFDTAQCQEALRTAYVAITRAITYCYWYINKDDNRGTAMEKATRHIDPALPCWSLPVAVKTEAPAKPKHRKTRFRR